MPIMLCGNNASPITIETDQLVMVFHSDGAVTSTGFSIDYSTATSSATQIGISTM